jgi:rubrerythrin/predicted phosphodiesterase
MSIQKIEQEIRDLGTVQSFSIIGDPGCEGLGTTMMQVYANALQTAGTDDFTMVIGDFVPEGSARFYKAITGLTNAIAIKDVYALRGNHDTGEYDDYFGLHNYVLLCGSFTIVVLDNAYRKFEQQGLDLLEQILQRDDVRHVVVAFHIPIPNHYTGNSVSDEEFAKLRRAYSAHKEKIDYFVCGHVHSRFVDRVDGIPFICSGGGGAMIEDVSANIKAADVEHHIVRFCWNGTALTYHIQDLNCAAYTKENGDPIGKEKVFEAVQSEMMAHFMYLMFAERAERRGYTKIANLFQALAESEYRHARSFYAILDQAKPFLKTIGSAIPLEIFEYEHSYRMMRDYAKDKDMPLIRQTFAAASAAEESHAKLLAEAEQIDGFKRTAFYVCPVCGYFMTDEDKQPRCPMCGAPARDYLLFDSSL